MQLSNNYSKPRFIEAFIVTFFIISIISISISQFNAVPHIPIIVSILLLLIYGLIKKIPFSALEKSMTSGAASGIGAVYIFVFIGLLISSWIIGGTIPTLLYIGFTFVTASFFYVIVFIVTSVVGTVIGSSLTTVATIGVALLGIASAVDASLAITAGAIVSGAFFGDKMSPLSDTTNLAASIVGVDLFTHIRNMMYTTIPAFMLATIGYALLSPNVATIDSAIIANYKNALNMTNLVHWYSLLPLLVLIVCTLLKVPALLTLALSAVSGVILSYIHMPLSFEKLCEVLYSGYVSTIGVESIDLLLTRGGISSMFFTILLVILSLSMGGLLFALGIIQSLLATIEKSLKSIGAVITGAAFTAIGINVLIGEQYLSILLTGEAFKEKFSQLSLHPKNLSRVMEDAGTVINPLVPWSVCGLFIASMLDVSVMSYLPFAFFCLLSPVLTIVFGWLNITISKS